jgi:hypothetical protein
MQGRRSEGIDWLKRLEPNWEGANNLKHHLFWHRAMFHLERREFDEVLSLYDHGFRDLGSPLTQAMPDMYIDVQNAASMLFRLERQGVDVGERWVELADKAEARIGDSSQSSPRRTDDGARRHRAEVRAHATACAPSPAQYTVGGWSAASRAALRSGAGIARPA